MPAYQAIIKVPPCGIEPQPSEPESEILSIKLRGRSTAKLANNYQAKDAG